MRKLKKILVLLRRRLTLRWLYGRLEYYFIPPGLARALTARRKVASMLLPGNADPEVVRKKIAHLKDALWMGFSHTALRALREISLDPTVGAQAVYEATSVLAYWHASHGDYEAALERAVAMRSLCTAPDDQKAQVLLEADCHMALGQRDQARYVLEPLLRRRPSDIDLQLSFCNALATFEGQFSAEADAERLMRVNRIFHRLKLAELVLIAPYEPFAISNIQATATASLPLEEQPRVTVIIPAYKAEHRLGITVRGLLAQSWTNLEIIIVDDESPDGTFRAAEELAKRDSRIIALRQANNSGSYSARNLAMTRASGEFITTHDADDWSHPQKVEIQARHLMKHPEVHANLTQWVRCFGHLYFRSTARRSATHVTLNHSSLMVRRATLDKIGYWDPVRIAADAELISRIEAYGGRKVSRVMTGVPLSFALDASDSLTRTGHTHVFTRFHGVRRVYHEASRYWRDVVMAGRPVLSQGGERPFPVAGAILPRRVSSPRLDLLFVFDFAMTGGAYVSTRNYVEAAVKAGKKVGVFHYPRFDLDPARLMSEEIQRMVHEGAVHRVCPGEEIHAQYVVVGYPVVLRYPIDLPPRVVCDRFFIVTNQMNARLYSGKDVQYDPAEVAANVRSMFGQEPTWIPISDLVRGLMERDGRYSTIHSATWTPLIDTETWCSSTSKWRGAGGALPTIGRHGRDHYTKWLTEPAALAAAYCVNQKCKVELLGGAKHALSVLSSSPHNWTVHSFGARDTREFLGGLDFFVHYPHEDYIEEFGRAVLEAMAVGVPVILPPVFRPTFGEAALYAEPSEVWPLILEIWRSEAAWLARVEAGRRFVLENGDWAHFERRVQALNGAAPTAGG